MCLVSRNNISLFSGIKKEKDRVSCCLWRLDRMVALELSLNEKGRSVPMILSTVVVSRLVMVTTWPSAVQNCSVLVPIQPTWSKPRGKNGSITFCIEEMNPFWCSCNIKAFYTTLSWSCTGKYWLSCYFTELKRLCLSFIQFWSIYIFWY